MAGFVAPIEIQKRISMDLWSILLQTVIR